MILEYFELWSFSVFPWCQYTHQAGRTPALQQNWQSPEKSQNLKEKTQYLMNTLYVSGSAPEIQNATSWVCPVLRKITIFIHDCEGRAKEQKAQ